MKYFKLLWLVPVLVFVALVIGIIKGGTIMHKQKSAVYEKCQKTDLYVIGYKGHRNRIYDCSGIEL